MEALGAYCYSVTHYLVGPPTVRLIFSKGRITPKGKTSIGTIPRLELASNLLGKEVVHYRLPFTKLFFEYKKERVKA